MRPGCDPVQRLQHVSGTANQRIRPGTAHQPHHRRGDVAHMGDRSQGLHLPAHVVRRMLEERRVGGRGIHRAHADACIHQLLAQRVAQRPHAVFGNGIGARISVAAKSQLGRDVDQDP